MKIWKVYANCAKSANPVKEISEEEAKELIFDAVGYLIGNSEISVEVIDDEDDDEYNAKVDELKAKALEDFEKTGIFECGDFAVISSEEQPERGDVYGWSKWFY